MALSYFNKIVNYDTLDVGNLELVVNNITMESMSLVYAFVSSSKYMESSILTYFNEVFDDLDEANLYKYLEKAIRIIHRIEYTRDNTFLYFLYSLQIPRKVLSFMAIYMIAPYTKYFNNPTDGEENELDTDKTTELLWYYLRGEIVNIEESIQYYAMLIQYTYYGDLDIDLIEEVLEEAAEIYADNRRYDLFFINYTNIYTEGGGSNLREYLGLPSNTYGKNIPMPRFILHNYSIICGDEFTVHDPLLDYLPANMRSILINDKNNTYDTHLDKSRSNDMKGFLELVYDKSIGGNHVIYKIPKRELIILLIDLTLIYDFNSTPRMFAQFKRLGIHPRRQISLKDFMKMNNISMLRNYVNNFDLERKEDIDFIDNLWHKINLFRKSNYLKEAVELYQIMVKFIMEA